MGESLRALADWLASGPTNGLATDALGGIPGLPPVLQTVHLLSAAVLMGSAVLLLMRVQGLALRDHSLWSLRRQLMPWAIGALSVQPLSMLPFLLARPHRYLLNPVFGIKMGLLLVAIISTVVVSRRIRLTLSEGDILTRLVAVVALLAWLAVVLAGRWIAYSDYLFWPA
ncbi:MAG: DUF6644 family protein [Pseudomonadota bacterium]